MGDFWRYIAALTPSTGVGFLFYLIIRATLEGDRRERLALAQWEAAHPETRTEITEILNAAPEGIDGAGSANASDEGATTTKAHSEQALDACDATVTRRTSEQE